MTLARDWLDGIRAATSPQGRSCCGASAILAATSPQGWSRCGEGTCTLDVGAGPGVPCRTGWRRAGPVPVAVRPALSGQGIVRGRVGHRSLAAAARRPTVTNRAGRQRDLLRELQTRGILQKLDDKTAGPGIRYGPGRHFPTTAKGRQRRRRQTNTRTLPRILDRSVQSVVCSSMSARMAKSRSAAVCRVAAKASGPRTGSITSR